MSKKAYAWIFNWGEIGGVVREPSIRFTLFFSTPEKFEELYAGPRPENDILFLVQVPDDFDDWDFIPDNY